MANVKTGKGTIGILTGGGDVPGLNPAIRALTVRALREGYRVLGIRRGWAGLIEIDRDTQPGPELVLNLTEEVVNKVGRTGGTFLHTSRTRPSHIPAAAIPDHLRDTYTNETNDLTKEVLANLEFLGIDRAAFVEADINALLERLYREAGHTPLSTTLKLIGFQGLNPAQSKAGSAPAA